LGRSPARTLASPLLSGILIMSDSPPAFPPGQTRAAVGLPTLGSIRIREELESEVEACARELMELVPRMRLRRTVFDGQWVLGVHVGGLEDADLAFSRLDMRLAINMDGQEPRVRLTRCITVRNRDQETAVFQAVHDAEGRRRLSGFIESAFLEFTRLYFETR
jgi:hypothetical protein